MTPATKALRILVADDHVTVRTGLSAILGRRDDLEVVAEAADGRAAVELWRHHRPDVTLIDLRMPGIDGVGVIAEIRRTDPAALFIVLTTYDSDNDVSRAVQAGARGYLLKDAPTEELLACIDTVRAGGAIISPALVGKLASGIQSEPLTPREHEVLELLSQGMSNRQMASRLAVGEATIKTHLRNIFTKLDVISRTEAIAAACQRGYIRL